MGLIPARLQNAGAQPARHRWAGSRLRWEPALLLRHPSRPLLDHIFEEGGGEVVIGNVASVEEQPPIWAPFLGRGQGDLAVLHHLVDTVHSAHHADRLCGVGLLHHLPKESNRRERPLETLLWPFST